MKHPTLDGVSDLENNSSFLVPNLKMLDFCQNYKKIFGIGSKSKKSDITELWLEYFAMIYRKVPHFKFSRNKEPN